MRNIIYCRVSNLKDDSQSFSKQEKNCVEYCKEHKMRVREIHKEHNSGFRKQKILDSLIMRSKNINLIINDITRFSRHNAYGLSLLKRCIKNRINIHFVREGVIFDHENELISTKILSGLNNSEGEWKTIRQNIINNIKKRRSEGLTLGTTPFGYDCVEKKLIKNNNFNVIKLIVYLRNGVKTSAEMQTVLKELTTNYESLKFYDAQQNEINKFAKVFTLKFSEIANILNDYGLCDKNWTNDRVRDLYKKYCMEETLKEDTEVANAYSIQEEINNRINVGMQMEYY
jgi:DNA invertase Pin-like site-specific DNA recombinase